MSAMNQMFPITLLECHPIFLEVPEKSSSFEQQLLRRHKLSKQYNEGDTDIIASISQQENLLASDT